MKFRTLGTIAFTAAVMASASAFAQSNDDLNLETEELPNKKLEQRGERIRGPITSITAAGLLFASFDKNFDYLVDKNEFTTGQEASFKSADTDQSGTLSLFELADWRKAALGSLDAAPANLAFDKNYDQRITTEEFRNALNYVYNVNDKDGNSVLSFEEMIRVFEIPRRGRTGQSEGQGQRQGQRQRGNRDGQRQRGGGRR